MIFIDTATLSLNSGAKPVEVYVPLWLSGGSSGVAGTGYGAAGNHFINDGSFGVSTSTSGSSTKIFTLSENTPPNTMFALEATLFYASSSSNSTANAQLYNVTSSSLVESTSVTTTSLTAIVVRSGTFTLTQGHVYAITIWSGVNQYNTNLIDASLIIFP